jgi:magnesium chelatase family protein
MTEQEALEVTMVYSVAGLLRRRDGLITQHPFRAPHHTCSVSALVGGGSGNRPGEVSLAHNGILFLDELTEWRKDCLESVFLAANDQEILQRNGVVYPSDFIIVGAMNPCPCGYRGDPRHQCTCSPEEIARYLNRVKPFMDSFDIIIEAPAVPFRDLTKGHGGETSEQVRERVIKAQKLMVPGRQGDLPNEAIRLLDIASERLHLSSTAIRAILSLTSTISDLEGEGEDVVKTHHVSEALQYKVLDRV